MKTKEQKHQSTLKRIEKFRLIDDDFMTVCFDGNIELVQFVIRIIMNNPNINIISVQTQVSFKNLYGRSIRMDAYATDDCDKRYNIEIQRVNNGAGAKRARFNSSLIDCKEIPSGFKTEHLPESYVIFITEHDVLGKGLPIYHIDRYIEETGEKFQDESHIIYVNAENKENNELGKLMHDFLCDKADDMNYPIIAKTVRHYKENEEGVKTMCKEMEKMIKEERLEERMVVYFEAVRDEDMTSERAAAKLGMSLGEFMSEMKQWEEIYGK